MALSHFFFLTPSLVLIPAVIVPLSVPALHIAALRRDAQDLSRLPLFKELPEPSRLDSFIISNQIESYCNELLSVAKQSFRKQYVIKAVNGGESASASGAGPAAASSSEHKD